MVMLKRGFGSPNWATATQRGDQSWERTSPSSAEYFLATLRFDELQDLNVNVNDNVDTIVKRFPLLVNKNLS